MDLSDPTRAITPTLDGTVLAVLAAAGRPLTVGQVAEQAARGSEIGIRRSLARLVEQGTVRATIMGRNTVHELNEDHVAAVVAKQLADLRPLLWRRFRDELRSWHVRPLYGIVFGSAARGDGDAASDIDLLLVHPPFVGEKKPRRPKASTSSAIADAVGSAALSVGDAADEERWMGQLDALREKVRGWTGNYLQIVDLTFHDWRHPSPDHTPLLTNVREDGVELVKARGLALWPTHD